jgi:hypothetical protein
MSLRTTFSRIALGGALLAAALLTGSTFRAQAQSSDRWIHVRVDNPEDKGEMVHVNVPVALAEVLVSSVDHDELHHGHISVGHADLNGVDLRAMLDAVRSAPDGEFVSVKKRDQDIHVSKQNGLLLIHVTNSNRADKQEVQITVPITVVQAMVAASKGSDDLDVGAALKALAALGNSELVNVKDGKKTIHIWIDSKNSAD